MRPHQRMILIIYDLIYDFKYKRMAIVHQVIKYPTACLTFFLISFILFEWHRTLVVRRGPVTKSLARNLRNNKSNTLQITYSSSSHIRSLRCLIYSGSTRELNSKWAFYILKTTKWVLINYLCNGLYTLTQHEHFYNGKCM